MQSFVALPARRRPGAPVGGRAAARRPTRPWSAASPRCSPRRVLAGETEQIDRFLPEIARVCADALPGHRRGAAHNLGPMSDRRGGQRRRGEGQDRAAVAGVLPSQALSEAIDGRVGQLRRLPDPARGDPAGQHRPAARRLRLGAALQLPARRRLDRRGEDRGPRLPEGRPARRRRARARPALPGAADRGAGAARRRPRQGQPEELDRPPRRLHPGDHRPPPPLRRDPRRLPRQALPGGRAALLRDPGARPGSRSTSCAWRAATCGSTTREIRDLQDEFPLLYLDSHALRESELALADGLFLSVDLSGPGDRIVGYRAKKNSLPIDLSRIRAYRWTDYWDPVYPEAGGADRARAGDLLPAALGRGRLHPAADRRRDDGLRPDRRRAAHPLRRLLRPRLRLRPERRPPRQPRGARGARPRRLLHGRAPPAGLQAGAGADRRAGRAPLRRRTSAPTTRAR